MSGRSFVFAEAEVRKEPHHLGQVATQTQI